MINYTIKKPVWNTKSVGIAAHRLLDGATMAVSISYKDADGQLVYPYKYIMACRKMKTYPVQKLGSGITLHIIPIADFEAVE